MARPLLRRDTPMSRPPAHRALLAVAIVACLTPSPAAAWQRSIMGSQDTGEDVGRSVAIAASGNVIVGGHLDCVGTILALDRASGGRLWQEQVGGTICGPLNDG